MSEIDGKDEEIQDLDELHEVIDETFAITSYGADYPVDSLVSRMVNGDIVVPTFSAEPEEGQSTVGFQREYVWTKTQADRFIESLLLGLPVPGIFLVKENNNKFLVLDGQQRLRTLHGFFKGLFKGTEFILEDVQTRWKDKKYETLHADDRRRIDNSIIHATIIRQDEPDGEQNSVYLIFERLNSGGTILKPQEIRVALYNGKLVSLLSELNTNSSWRTLYGRKDSRLKDIELIVRFLALYYYEKDYSRPMKKFLNRYMSANRELEKQSEIEIRNVFESTTNIILSAIGPKAFRPNNPVNGAVVDSLMVGIANRLKSGHITSLEGVKSAYEALLKNADYSISIGRAIANEEMVASRLRLSKQAFQEIE